MIPPNLKSQTLNSKQFSNFLNYNSSKFVVLRILILIIGIYLGFRICNLVFPVRSRAASLSVSLSVGLTYFTAAGTTSPGALVVLGESGATLASTTTATDGVFSLTVLVEDGTHTFDLYATDSEGLTTSTLSHTVALTAGTTTTLGNLVLPPTLSGSPLTTAVGEDVLLSGLAAPSSDALVYLAGQLITTVPAGSTGAWEARLSTGYLTAGSYNLVAQNRLPAGYLSADSSPLTLSLSPAPLPSPGTSTTTSTSSEPAAAGSPSPSPTPRLPGFLLPFDTDKSDSLTLAELSELVYRFLQSWIGSLKRGRPGTCDLNHDGVCNLVDLSILLYYVDR